MKKRIIITFLVLIMCAMYEVKAGVFDKSINCIIVNCGNDEMWAKVADRVAEIYQVEGYNVGVWDATVFLRNESEVVNKGDVWVIVAGDSLPPASSKPFEKLLQSGKDIVVLSAPIWNDSRLWDGESLLTFEDFARKHRKELFPDRDFIKNIPVDSWRRESNNIGSPASLRYVDNSELFEDEIFPAFQALVIDMKGWDVFTSPALENPFGNGEDVTVFFAKGSGLTNYLTLEWREKDFSRWITSVPLTNSWNYYVLTPEMFNFWEGPPERKGTRFMPENAMQFCFGLTMSHSPIPTGKHSFWIAGLGTQKKNRLHELIMQQRVNLPKLEILYPDYKFYYSNDVKSVRVLGEILPWMDREEIIVPNDLRLIHPRPSAGGYDKTRGWRWAPLLECYGKEDAYRGAMSAVMLYSEGKFKGSVIISFAVHQPQWYLENSTLELIKTLARRIKNRIYFLDTGTEFYTYFPEQDIKVGSNVVNLSSVPRENVKVEISLYDRGNRTLLSNKTFVKDKLNPSEVWNLNESLGSTNLSRELVVESKLFINEELLEQVSHNVNVWTPKEKKEYITIQDGDFIYRGKRWCPYGVNYMPSSGIGTEDGAYFEFWLGKRSYDPKVIQRDLERIVMMGMNSISVFLHYPSMLDQNLLDLLYRADKLGLKVNLSLRPGTPFDFEWEKIKEMIEFYRLPEHDEIFAYDLAWEPMFPGHEGRKRWDVEWEKWVINRYGSIENAEVDWKYSIPRDSEGKVTNPSDEQLMKEGEWRVMVCAYRRFLDTLLYKYYNRARKLVRSIDNVHAVSFRMTEACNPTNSNANPLPYDWYYLACAVDILEPEGYGRIGNWEVIKPAIFQVQYGRLCNPEIPLIWAEMGFNVFRTEKRQFEIALDTQARFYQDFLRMVLESSSDGIYFWWYPGGYRVNEKSDFGIINPDGTFRPVSRVILENSDIFGKQELKEPDTYIEIDRDETSRGIAGIYEKVKDDFWRVWDSGKVPGLKTAGTNSTSANCPLIAVGNTEYRGSNPLKYLDSFFDVVRIKKGNGESVDVEEYDGVVELSEQELQNSSLFFEITNLGEALWLSSSGGGDKEGCVYLVLSGLVNDRLPINSDVKKGGTISFTIPLPNRYGQINVCLESYGRARFGEKRSILIKERINE